MRDTVECIENKIQCKEIETETKNTQTYTHSHSVRGSDASVCACLYFFGYLFYIVSLSSPSAGIAISFARTSHLICAFRHFRTNTTKKVFTVTACCWVHSNHGIHSQWQKERKRREHNLTHTQTHRHFGLTLAKLLLLIIIYYTFDIERLFIWNWIKFFV